MKKEAFLRLALLFFVLINQISVTMGYNPLPFSEEELYQALSSFLTVVTSVYVWWKNNNVTKEARKAQERLNSLKNKE